MPHGATPTNGPLADQLEELAALLRLAKTDRFRVRAYERAAQVVRASPLDLRDMTGGEISRLEGVGSAIAGLIAEYLRDGRIAMLDALRESHPPGLGALLRLPLIGVRDARVLAQSGFGDVAGLQAAADHAGLAVLDDRLAARVHESLRRFADADDGRVPMPLARRAAQALATAFAAVEGVDQVLVGGSVRRAVETVGTYAFVIVCSDEQAVASRIAASREVVRVVSSGPGHMSVVTAAGRPAELVFSDRSTAGTALFEATGPDAHVEAVRERREPVAAASEHDVYAAAGLAFVPPELRDSADAVDAAEADAVPALVSVEDRQGDLHVHTDWSGDGKASLDDMVAAAAARGYAYLALTDHAENLKINGMPRAAVLRRRDAIARAQERHPEIRLLDAAELNIGLTGDIDYDLEFLLQFDIGVASIHSHMDRLTPVQTDRILAAMAHPAVHVIGHPTGRILGHRPPYGIDIEAIAQAAAETGTALEVNGSPRRLDLNGDMVRVAIAAGAAITVSSDAHSVPELDYVQNAVPTARRGWATRASVLNCRSLDDLLRFTRRKAEKAS